MGIRREYLDGHALWLVAFLLNGKKNGLSWYLTNVEGNRNEVIETVMDAYGLRWRDAVCTASRIVGDKTPRRSHPLAA